MANFDSSGDEGSEVDLTPFRVDWLDLSSYGCTEKFGLSALPGCRFKDVWRSLKDDLNTLKALEVRDVFVLCTNGELTKYRVRGLLEQMAEADLVVHHHPFPDGTVPTMALLMKILEPLRVNLMQGRRSLVHCFGGLGRTSLVSVCLLMLLDPELDCETALKQVKELRGPGAIQSVKQYNFVQEFREKLAEFEKMREELSRSVSR